MKRAFSGQLSAFSTESVAQAFRLCPKIWLVGDDLVNSAYEVEDPDERARLTSQAAQLAAEEVVWAPLYETVTTMWLGDRVTGADPSINYMYFPWAAKIGGR